MEMLIAVIVAGIVTLVMMKLIFPNKPTPSKVFDASDNLKKLSRSLLPPANKKKTQLSKTQYKLLNPVLSSDVHSYNNGIIITDLEVPLETNNGNTVKAKQLSWREVTTYPKVGIAPSQTGKKNKIYLQDLPTVTKVNAREQQRAKIEKFLQTLVGQKDLVSGEILKSGEKVYVCLHCRLGYHEDSWYYLNRMCEQCKADEDQVKSFILPKLPSPTAKATQPKIKTPIIQGKASETTSLEPKNYSFRKNIKD
jgi:hypothetical protein